MSVRRHLAEPVSVTGLAREVGISTRGLQLVLRRTGLGTPQAALRGIRMAAAHDALAAADGAVRSIDVGRRFGRSDLGRFDAHDFDAFDRLPEDDVGTAEPETPAVR